MGGGGGGGGGEVGGIISKYCCLGDLGFSFILVVFLFDWGCDGGGNVVSDGGDSGGGGMSTLCCLKCDTFCDGVSDTDIDRE